MRTAQRKFAIVLAVCSKILFLPVVHHCYALDMALHNHVISKSQWKNYFSDSSRPYHQCNLFRRSAPLTFFRPLRQRKKLQVLAFNLQSANDEYDDTEWKNNVSEYLILPTHKPSASNNTNPYHLHRRQFLFSSLMLLTSTTTTLFLPPSASARGLVHFPCVRPLANSYHFMRVGVTLLEEQGTKSE